MFLLADTWDDFFMRWGAGILIFLCTTVASYILGRWWGERTARKEWLERRFLGRINIGVNSFLDDRLTIRTLAERSLEDVFLNSQAVQAVRRAANQTTPEDPLLPLAANESWFLLNCVLNITAELFSAGVFRRDAGEPVRALRYCLFLTNEQAGPDETRKVRALLIQEAVLQNFPYADGIPQLESPGHKDRLDTLRVAARRYQSHPHLFMSMEVYL